MDLLQLTHFVDEPTDRVVTTFIKVTKFKDMINSNILHKLGRYLQPFLEFIFVSLKF